MLKGIISVCVAIVVLLVASPASAHTLSKWESEVRTRIAVSDRAYDDCDYKYDFDTPGTITFCEFSYYPEISFCMRVNKHEVRCNAHVDFMLDVIYEDFDRDDEYLTVTCTYSAIVKYPRKTSYRSKVKVTSGPSSCY